MQQPRGPLSGRDIDRMFREQQAWVRRSARRGRAPWWAWLLFWIVLSPIIVALLYFGTIWMVFVLVMAFCGWVLGDGKTRRRRRRW